MSSPGYEIENELLDTHLSLEIVFKRLQTMPQVVQFISVPGAHALRQVHMRQVNLVCITQGTKEIWHEDQWQTHKPGELLLFAAKTQWCLHNLPGQNGRYTAQVLTVADDWLDEFETHPSRQNTHNVSALTSVSLTGWIEQAWLRVSDPALQDASEALTRHRVLELLLVLAEAGHSFERADRILLQNRIHALIRQAPGQVWTAASLAERFHMSPSTLLRRLQEEGTNPTRCARDARLEYALNLLQTTRLPVGQIAQSCGYGSHSRFSTAFEQQFGILPLKFRQQTEPAKAGLTKKPERPRPSGLDGQSGHPDQGRS